VKLDNRIIDRIALPGRHKAEFDRIGLDRAKLLELAQRSGGAVIEPDETTALNLPRKTASHDLTRAAGCISAVAVLLGLLAAHYARRKVM
jgi:hypothetical protein